MKRVTLAVIGMLLSAPALAGGGHFGGGGHFAPRDIITPPANRSVGIFRPHDIITPPAAHPIEFMHPGNIIAPPSGRGTINSVGGPLVKPAWKD